MSKKLFTKSTVRNIILTILFAAIYFYVVLPPINLQSPDFYTFVFISFAVYCALSLASTISGSVKAHMYKTEEEINFFAAIKSNCRIPFIICVILVVVVIIGSIISSVIFNANKYSQLLVPEAGDFATDIDEISYTQIPMLDEDSAKKLGDRKLGELSDMVSQFEVADDYNQINYKNEPVRVTPLIYGDLIKWFNNRSEGLPAYIIINMVTQEVEVVRLEEGMKYSTCEHFGRNVYRHLRFKYPTFIFDEPSFEIDDNGVPYWVCPRIVKTIGLFGGEDIKGAVLMNAITGECEYYEDVPEWIDKVYSDDLIIEQYDYYGTYKNGFFNSIFGQKDVTITTDGSNYIAINDDVYVYTGITSVGSDESNVGFILSNMRTKETKYYAIPGAEEYSAMSSAEGVVQHLSYKATFPLLLNISSEPTYFMALKDSADLVKMYAMVNVQQYQIVATGSTVAECEQKYVELLASKGILSSDDIDTGEIVGTISDIRTAVIDGNTFVYIKLDGSDIYYSISAADAPVAVLLSVGDTVAISAPESQDEIVNAYSVKRKESVPESSQEQNNTDVESENQPGSTENGSDSNAEDS